MNHNLAFRFSPSTCLLLSHGWCSFGSQPGWTSQFRIPVMILFVETKVWLTLITTEATQTLQKDPIVLMDTKLCL